MSKKTLRIITIISTIALTLCLCTLSFAAATPKDITIDSSNTTEMDTLGGKIMGFIQAAGIIISVAVLMVLGIKYMMGSAEEKAEYKKVFIPYIVGAILLFAATTIANAIYNAVNNF